MTRFRVWLEGDLEEDDGKEYEDGWISDSRDAAKEHAECMSDSGDFSDHVGERFDVLVRDLSSREVSKVEIAWEYDPRPYVVKCEKLESTDV